MIAVYNPANGSVVGEAPEMSASDAKAAIDRTYAAFPAWSRRLARERSESPRA